MRNMVKMRYGSFYDVPRGIVLRYKGRYFYLSSAFDEIKDEYPDDYSVYSFPETMESVASSESWGFVRELGSLQRLGSLKISDCTFDKSKRKEFDASVLDRFLVLLE